MTYDIIFATRELRRSLHTPFDIPFFNVDVDRPRVFPWRDDRDYLVAIDEDLNVVGVICFRKDSDIAAGLAKRPCLGVGYVSVSSFHKKKGIGRAMLKRIFAYAKEHKRSIRFTDYEAEGEMYLKPLIHQEATEHPYSVFEFMTRIH